MRRPFAVLAFAGSLLAGCAGFGAASPAAPLASEPGATSLMSTSPSASIPGTARAQERARIAELLAAGTDVYTVPDPFEVALPGRLVKIESLLETSDVRVYRMLYHSRSADGASDVGVTGTVWVPAAAPPSEGYPIIAWGPGSNGWGDPCAASHKALDDSENAWLLRALVQRGYVVASTDYTGHGTRFPEQTIVPEATAYAMLDAARAARDLLGSDTSDRVIVGGHSLGADNGLMVETYGPAYASGLDIRGVLALEGGTDHRRYVEHNFAEDGTGETFGILGGVLQYAMAYPELRVEDVIQPSILADVRRTPDSPCFEWAEIFGPHSLDAVYVNNPLDLPDWAARIDAQAPQRAPYPIFFAIAPTSDWHEADLTEVADRLCLDARHVVARVYEGTDHDSSKEASLHDVTAWLADRFSGRAPAGTCKPVLPG